MKTLKSIFATLVVLFSISSSAFAASADFVYDTKYNDHDVMISKTVFKRLEGETTLFPKLKYEYVYNENGQLSEKIAMKWNSENQEWENAYHYKFSYRTDNSIEVEYAAWNRNKRRFNLNVETKDYSKEEIKQLMTMSSSKADNSIAMK